MYKSSLVIVILVAVLTVSLWAYFNRPDREPPWPERVQGFSFSPFRANEDAVAHKLPTEAEITQDLQLISGWTDTVRTYTVEGSLGEIPRLAHPFHVRVMLGAWVDNNRDKTQAELTRLIDIARHNRNVSSVMVGNEVMLR